MTATNSNNFNAEILECLPLALNQGNCTVIFFVRFWAIDIQYEIKTEMYVVNEEILFNKHQSNVI